MPAGRIYREKTTCEKYGHTWRDDNRFSTEPCMWCGGGQRRFDGSEAALDAALKREYEDKRFAMLVAGSAAAMLIYVFVDGIFL